MNIIITGTSQGIGFELTRKFAALPQARIIAISRNIGPLSEFTQHFNISALSYDISGTADQDQLTDMIDTFLDKRVDILINNAGQLVNKPFSELSDQDFDLMFDVNVKGAVKLIRTILPYFCPGSHIVNIGSMGGFQGSTKFAGLSLYSASKGALAVLSECLAEEFKPREISVNTLALAAVNTEMLRAAFPGYAAKVTAGEMASYIMEFAINGHKVFNGKILPVSLSVP